MIPAICIEMLFGDQLAHEKAHATARAGFDHIEFWGWRDKDIQSLSALRSSENITVANFSAHRRGSPIAAETHETVLEDFRSALAAADRLQCTTLMFLSNELGEGGRVVNSYPAIAEEKKFDNFVELLIEADKIAPPEMNLVIEPLNVTVDHPGNYLRDMATAAAIVEACGSSRVSVLCDLYHLGTMGADLIQVIETYHSHIGYVHVADIPGRHEPGTGTVDWQHVLKTLKRFGYDGYVGFEYAPSESSEESLRAIKSMWSNGE